MGYFYYIMCTKTLGLVEDVRVYTTHHNVCQIWGLVSEVQAYTDTIICIRTMGARRGCASMHNTPKYVYEQWGLVRDVRS